MTAAETPLVSVIVPTCNHDRYIGTALDSIRAQGMEDLEVIVVDDGSDTPVDELVRAKLPDATILRQENAGPSAARNAGIARSRGRFVTFLDADDLWLPTTLKRLLRGFRDAPRADIVQGSLRQFITPEDTPSLEGARNGPAYQCFNLGALLLRREVFDHDRFDESLRCSEDVDLFIRWSERGLTRLVIPDVVLRYRKYVARGEPAAVTKAMGPDGAAVDTCSRWLRLLHQSAARRRLHAATMSAEGIRSISVDATALAVSVVVTVRNGMPHLAQAIDAIRRQTLTPREIVAVVGSSVDGTLEYLRSEPGIHIVEPPDDGLAAARNAALKIVTSPLVAFCDHDDLWHPAKLEKQAAAVAQFADPAASIVNVEAHTEEAASPPKDDPFGGVPTLGWTAGALLAHRDVFAAVGPFDPSQGLDCDADWFRRLRQLGIPCAVAGRVLLRRGFPSRSMAAAEAEQW